MISVLKVSYQTVGRLGAMTIMCIIIFRFLYLIIFLFYLVENRNLTSITDRTILLSIY